MRAMKYKPVRRAIYAMVVTGMVQELLGAMVPPPEDDDEDGRNTYERLDEWVKQRKALFIYGPEPGQYVTFNMGLGYNFFHNLGRQIVAYSRGAPEADGKPVSLAQVISRLAWAYTQAFLPAGLDELLVPTVASPFVEIGLNEDYFGRQIMPTKYPGDHVSDSHRYFNSVNGLTREVAGFLNSWTGGDAFESGLIDVSPESIEHVIKSFSGAAGAAAWNLLTTGQKLTGEVTGTNVEDPQLGVRNVPFVRKFLGSASPWQTRDMTYRRLDEMELLATRLKPAQNVDPAAERRRIAEVKRENGPLVYLVDDARKLRRELGKIRKERLAIKADDASAATRRSRMERLEKREAALMSAFNRRYLRAIKRVEARTEMAVAA